METCQLELAIEHNGCCEVWRLKYCPLITAGMNSTEWKPGNKTTMWLPLGPNTPHCPCACQCQSALAFSLDVSHCTTYMEHNAPSDPGPVWVIAHKCSSPRAGICQNSVLDCGLMFLYISPYSVVTAECQSAYLCLCMWMSRHLFLLPLPMQPAMIKTIFFLINHTNSIEQS